MTLRAILPRLLLALAIAGAAVCLGLNRDQLDPALIESSIRDFGLWAPLDVLFAIGTILFVPGAIFVLACSGKAWSSGTQIRPVRLKVGPGSGVKAAAHEGASK